MVLLAVVASVQSRVVSFEKQWLEMIPESPPRVVAWASALFLGAMTIAFGWSISQRMANTDSEGPAGGSHGAATEVLAGASLAGVVPPQTLPGPQGDEEKAPESPEQPDPGDNRQQRATALVSASLESVPQSAAAPEAKRRVRRTPRPVPPLSAAQARRAKRDARALRGVEGPQGTVLRSRAVFAAVVDTEGTMWSDAEQQCSELNLGGVVGWRLPTRLEIADLRRKVPAVPFWTRSSDRKDPDAAWIYDAGRGRSARWLKQEPTGSVVCVVPAPRSED